MTGALVAIVTQGVQAARKIRSDEELQAELERIGFQDITGKKLPIGIFVQEQHGIESEEETSDKKTVDAHDGKTE